MQMICVSSHGNDCKFSICTISVTVENDSLQFIKTIPVTKNNDKIFDLYFTYQIWLKQFKKSKLYKNEKK